MEWEVALPDEEGAAETLQADTLPNANDLTVLLDTIASRHEGWAIWVRDDAQRETAAAKNPDNLSLDANWGAGNLAWELLTAVNPPKSLLRKPKSGIGVAVVVPLQPAVGRVGVVAAEAEKSRSVAFKLADAMMREVETLSGLTPEPIWDALSSGVRIAASARSSDGIKAAAITLHGRGRLVGPILPDRLIRFGVSEWK